MIVRHQGEKFIFAKMTNLGGPKVGKRHSFHAAAHPSESPGGKQEDRVASVPGGTRGQAVEGRERLLVELESGFPPPVVGLLGAIILSWDLTTSCLQDEQ